MATLVEEVEECACWQFNMTEHKIFCIYRYLFSSLAPSSVDVVSTIVHHPKCIPHKDEKLLNCFRSNSSSCQITGSSPTSSQNVRHVSTLVIIVPLKIKRQALE
ncbi:hypothetical protein RchiOBHm_Chr4g0395831 [Rosa chinensis]|uniref:Uncharacterized protein n=1 Tax=Rosa chinensis TaxID=74649 RepID=A0A2P6QRL6_ROSCH|nr:hypothetical protein RchiOBHm_Chr4g0395831 [Rosa chinensis]